MQYFEYKAKNTAGKIITGEKEVSGKSDLVEELAREGLIPISISLKKSRSGDIDLSHFKMFQRVKLSEKIVFTRNLGGMLTAGLTVNRSLDILQRQTTNFYFGRAISDISESIQAGGTLSSGLKKYPKIFSPLFVAMMEAGEESGSLPESLEQVSIQLAKAANLQRKIKGAMMYPSIIMGAMFLIGILMMIFVVPTLTSTFLDLGVQLPGSTRLVVGISDFLRNNTLVFLVMLAGVILGIKYLFKIHSVTVAFQKFIVKVPVLGTLVKEVQTAQTARTLSSLLSSGVTMTNALEITKRVVQNYHYKRVIQKGIDSIQKGIPLSVEFKAHSNLYPVMMGEMMEVGEETGNLSKMLEDIAVFYEEEVDNKTKNLSTIIEPVLMIFIGAAVGFFAVSMITPMYSLLDNI
ncbi:MAG: type IV pilus assembly protein PilC [Flavobacteriaceae bacterium]|jgi:type IV pilus assembly protein PilC